MSYFTTDYEAVEEEYEQLVTYKGSNGQMINDLAKSYTVSPDGLTYTFHIRPGVKFWDGTPLTAQSFIDEFERVLGKDGVDSPGESFIDPIVVGSTAYHNLKDKTGKSVSGITAPDPMTLVIKLTKPEPFFTEVLAMPFFSAVEEKFIQKVGNKAFDSTAAMGTGPFEMSSHDANGMVLKKNPHYWMTDSYGNHLPYLDKVTIRINKNANDDALNFQNGTTAEMGNLFQGIPSSAYPKFKTDPTLSKDLVSSVQNGLWYIGMNEHMAPFNNPKVRQAFEYAINREKIVQLQNGRGEVADQPLPPGIKGYVTNLDADAKYTYDPAKAKQLLKDAGVSNLSVTLYSQNDPDFTKWANAIQFDLQQIGVKCNIVLKDDNEFWNQAQQGKDQMFIGGWIQDFPDASDFLNTLLNSSEAPANNMDYYKNAQVDSWLNKAQTDVNQTERYQLYTKATNQIMKDAAWVPLIYPEMKYAVQPWVHGFFISPVMADPLQYMWIDSGHNQ